MSLKDALAICVLISFALAARAWWPAGPYLGAFIGLAYAIGFTRGENK